MVGATQDGGRNVKLVMTHAEAMLLLKAMQRLATFPEDSPTQDAMQQVMVNQLREVLQ